jgi:hypothetical protein
MGNVPVTPDVKLTDPPESSFVAIAVAIAENSASISVPLTIFAESPEDKESLAAKLVVLV